MAPRRTIRRKSSENSSIAKLPYRKAAKPKIRRFRGGFFNVTPTGYYLYLYVRKLSIES